MFLLRSFIYLLCLAGVASLIQLEGFELQQNALYSEETLTEHMQDILTLLSSILFFYASRINSQLKIACVLLATLTAMMFVREFDTYLEKQRIRSRNSSITSSDEWVIIKKDGQSNFIGYSNLECKSVILKLRPKPL